MRTINECRSCGSEVLVDMLDLGEQYTSDFRADDSKPPKYPLQAVICDDCMLVQLRHTTPSGDMYHDNYGFKSGVNENIRADLAEIVKRGLGYNPASWLDIASNDGTLLSFVPENIFRVGVDPITKYCREAERHADVIHNDFFKAELFTGLYDKFDVITSVSCFYDMDDPNKFVGDVKKVLADDGVWIIQQNYLLTTLQLGAVDNFCHEHLEYYTLLSLDPLLKRHGLEVFRVETNMVNGGSLRTYVCHKGTQTIWPSVTQQRRVERVAELHTLKPYADFADNARAQLTKLHDLVKDLHDKGRNVAILAASTRGSTIWQAAHIEPYIAYAVERNPEKVGRYFSAIGVPIISEADARQDFPAAMIVGPWFFADQIIDREADYLKRGGTLIVPLPDLKEVTK